MATPGLEAVIIEANTSSSSFPFQCIKSKYVQHTPARIAHIFANVDGKHANLGPIVVAAAADGM